MLEEFLESQMRSKNSNHHQKKGIFTKKKKKRNLN